MEKLGSLSPNAVWGSFELICQVPRPSKQEGQIIAFLLNFASKNHLEAKQDQAGNVLIANELLLLPTV